MDLVNLPHLRRLFARPNDSHKYQNGRVLIIGGSRAMAGAPVLAGKAALRSGAGVVELCVPECVAMVAASFDPCLITHHLSSGADGCFSSEVIDDLVLLAMRADIVVCGPGIGRSPSVVCMLKKLWQELLRTMIVDADALFALAQLTNNEIRAHNGIRIITPHAGEFQRLLNNPSINIQQSDEECRLQLENEACKFAKNHSTVVVLKGHKTLITDGVQKIHNTTGNPGMATAGSGDVLTGIIAALVGQKLPAFEAAELAVLAHGLSGDFAAQALTQLSVTANDIIDFLPRAWLHLQHGIASE